MLRIASDEKHFRIAMAVAGVLVVGIVAAGLVLVKVLYPTNPETVESYAAVSASPGVASPKAESPTAELTPAASPTAELTPAASPTSEPSSSESPAASTQGQVEAFSDAAATQLEPVYMLVGVDLVPGTYRTREPVITDGINGGILFDESCKFGQYSTPDGGIENLIAGGNPDGGRPTVTLSENQLFYSQRCGWWELVPQSDLFDSPDDAAATVGDGMWLVGEDIRPGSYRITSEHDPDAFCGWEVDSTWTDWDAEMLILEFRDEDTETVQLATGQQFVSTDCGEWERTGD